MAARALVGALGALLLAVAAAPSSAQDVAPGLDAFFPLVTRRPVVEHEIELRFQHDKGRDGRATAIALAIDWAVLPRWQVALAMPLIFTDPRDGSGAGGAGDLELENKVVLWQAPERKMLVAAGLNVRLPTGSEARGLGGETSMEPFASIGLGARGIFVLADLGYEWNLNTRGAGRDDQRVRSGVAVGAPVGRRLIPFVELTAVSVLRSGGTEVSRRLRDRVQLYLTPALNVQVLPEATLGLGIQLPLTEARAFDYALHASVDWEF